MIDIVDLTFCIGIPTILFALYVQFSPNSGNIWIRPNDKGEQIYVPYNLFRLIFYPFKEKSFWHPQMWDFNYFIYIIWFSGVWFAIKFFTI